jgi:GxxExxY protein
MLKTVGKKVGLLFNFGSPKPEFARLFFDRHEVDTRSEQGLARARTQLTDQDWLYPDLAYNIVGGLYAVHNALGPGFIHRIYANASFYELQSRGPDAAPQKLLRMYYKGVSVGSFHFDHIRVGADVMVFPVAIQDMDDWRFKNLKAWMKSEGVKLGILANFHATELKPVFLRA